MCKKQLVNSFRHYICPLNYGLPKLMLWITNNRHCFSFRPEFICEAIRIKFKILKKILNKFYFELRENVNRIDASVNLLK